MYQIGTKTDKACLRYHTFSKNDMASSQPSLMQLQNKLSWTCILTWIMSVPNLNENWQNMSKIPHIFKNQDGCQSAIFDQIVKQIVMDVYPNIYNVRTKFEQIQTKHIQDTTYSKIKMAASQPSLIRLGDKLSWTCVLTCIMYVPILNENWPSMSKIPHIFQKNKMAASRPSLIRLWNKLSWTSILTCVMYVPNLNKNRQSISKILHFQKIKMAASQPSLIRLGDKLSWTCVLTCIMYVPIPNKNWQSMSKIPHIFKKIRWLPVGHLWSDCEINCHGHIS